MVNHLKTTIKKAQLRKAILIALEEWNAPESEVVITLSDAKELRKLNHFHLGKDVTTDVLSFPSPDFIPDQLGDVILSWDHAKFQAKKRKVKAIEEATMLALHGVLHLLGYDDQTETERDEMIELQNQILKKVGMPTDDDWESVPYEEFF